MDGFRKILKKYHLEKWFQKENLIILILAGVLLIVITLPTKEKEEVYTGNKMTEKESPDETVQEVSDSSTVDYAADLEKKLTDILSNVQGVGSVFVMITLRESEELIVEKDTEEKRQQTIYETKDHTSVPYVIKTVFPKVEGVAVIAEGAENGSVKKNITEIVQALFDVELHKIKVTGSK